MILPIMYYGNPVLRKKTGCVDGIDAELRQLVQDMIETMDATDGAGLAAPQVNKSLSLFITKHPILVGEDTPKAHYIEGKLRIFINPKILAYSEEMTVRSEGCLSIPGLYGDVVRPISIKVQATNLEGELFEEELSGNDARAFMHENDHINGVLYIDRLSPKERKMLEPHLHKIKKQYR
ncbi:MAG: peptide deformylase [Parachlamydiaceae bacterium]|nr:peptide deformylase [Parachlamydiaceae bacterium]